MTPSFSAVVPAVMSQVELTSNTSTTQPICPERTVIFTCTTTDSSTLRWTSDEYIGQSNQYEFLSFQSVGTIESTPPHDAVANLTANTVNSDGMVVLTSTLQINTSSAIPSSRITCINGDIGSMRTSMVQVAGM